jgi:SAM-dependent methyltransferase
MSDESLGSEWDERFAAGAYPRDPEPSPVLCAYASSIPDGRALDIAAGTGRNTVYLADAGYDVDAIDASREGLATIRERATEHDVADAVSTIHADATTYELPTARYELVTMSFYHTLDRFPDLSAALVPGGYLFVEGHLRSTDSTPSGPSDDVHRFGSNDLLRAGLGLTVLHYDETTAERSADRRRATARLLARRSSGPTQSYPARPNENELTATDE